MSTPFAVQKIGHAVVYVSDLERSKRFYTEVLGFKVSDVYPGTMMPGGMVFLRCNGDHHCLALVGDRAPDAGADKSLHHLAFELATLDEVFRARDHLKAHGAKLTYRRPPPRRLPGRGRIPRSRRPSPRTLLGRRPDRRRRPLAAVRRNGARP